MDHSTKPFIPIEVYKVDIEKLQKAFGRSETKNGRISSITGLEQLPENGKLTFVISDNVFVSELSADRDNACAFPNSRFEEFCVFLNEEKKRTEFAEHMLKDYLESGIKFDVTKARILLFTDDGKRKNGCMRHDQGHEDDMCKSFYSFIPIIVRLIGEQVA